MEAGHLDIKREEVEVSSFINRVNRKFNALAKEKEVHFDVSVTGESIKFEMDVDRMEQVLTNIMDNSIRHTNKGGSVFVRSKTDKYGVHIEIEDTGSGIPEEDLPYVFERFYKADKARTRGNSGTGLGLAIAKHIIDAHHGEISVHSKVGRGTTFFIFLPRNNE